LPWGARFPKVYNLFLSPAQTKHFHELCAFSYSFVFVVLIVVVQNEQTLNNCSIYHQSFFQNMYLSYPDSLR